ncbi:SGNH/GDSL hydrolase family protein [Williamsia maris]|uniref:GDSL-like Lipase/Acylhydrolase family protein n=1 Tax=Williamsia maris TaxID=72806 RepID=A0ABT1HKL7_9NOCA|nr:SGNH/GDSL hydrolase family protein [Williamsia maris]MCP2178471.1 GDSL-like Lipase/Acylhydrolase family protein [Williamsia maris]
MSATTVRGAIELEETGQGTLPHRLPRWALEQVGDDRLAMSETQPAGVRLAFRSAATSVEVDVRATRVVYPGLPARPVGLHDLLVDGRLVAQASAVTPTTVSVDMATGGVNTRPGEVSTLRFDGLPGRAEDIVIWLPHNETTEIVAIRADAAIEPVDVSGRRRWLHHGSSISQGSNAESPSSTWPALTATATGLELTNLGFGGNALLDPCVARVMRDTPADLISVEIGINLVNTDLMRLRAFGPAVHGFLDTIRDGHPDTPLVVVSSICCPIHEETPGPGAFDPAALATGQVRFRATGDPAEIAAGKLTLRVIRDRLTDIVAQRRRHDPALHHVNGLDLYGPTDAIELPLPDALHPDTAGHRRIAERFGTLAFGPGGPFAR